MGQLAAPAGIVMLALMMVVTFSLAAMVGLELGLLVAAVLLVLVLSVAVVMAFVMDVRGIKMVMFRVEKMMIAVRLCWKLLAQTVFSKRVELGL